MTGLQYFAIPRGPVPDRYETIFEHAVVEGRISKIEQELFNGKEGIRYQLNENNVINLDLFSSFEIDVIKEVVRKYGRMNTSKIIKHSHLEKAWIENNAGINKISYNYSFDLLEV